MAICNVIEDTNRTDEQHELINEQVRSSGRFEVHACGLDRHVERIRKPAVERGECLELPLAELGTQLLRLAVERA